MGFIKRKQLKASNAKTLSSDLIYVVKVIQSGSKGFMWTNIMCSEHTVAFYKMRRLYLMNNKVKIKN